MRNWTIFAVIVCLLGSLILYETKIKRDFFSQSSYLIDMAKDKILNGESPSKEFEDLNRVWNSKKTSFYIFYSHNIVNNFEESLSKISVAAEIEDKEMMSYLIDELKNINDMFKKYHNLRVGNVF